MQTGDLKHFARPSDFRRWLLRNHAQAPELWLAFWRIDSGEPSITWPQSVDEALCCGWIDGIRKKLDDQRYCIRFTPRRPGSVWSAVNIARFDALQAEGRILPAGEAAFAARREDRSRIYAFEQGEVALGDHEAPLRANAAAWAFFSAQPPGYRKVITWWVISAKQEATRQRRLAQLIAACAAGQRLR